MDRVRGTDAGPLTERRRLRLPWWTTGALLGVVAVMAVGAVTTQISNDRNITALRVTRAELDAASQDRADLRHEMRATREQVDAAAANLGAGVRVAATERAEILRLLREIECRLAVLSGDPCEEMP